MAFLFQKFQEAVKTLAKSPTFSRYQRKIQFEVDMNRLFLYTSYNRLGSNADETDAEEIINLADKATFADQRKQVQENIHSQIRTFCTLMDEILIPNFKNTPKLLSSSPPLNQPAVPETNSSSRTELSQCLKDHIGYTLDIKASQIPHKEAGQGLFLSGKADIGAVVALYPGVTYSPAYYQCIPGYPRIEANNPYLITTYDGFVINAQGWGTGGATRELWDGLSVPRVEPLNGDRGNCAGEVLERRNPLALGHFANHPGKGMGPNVMVCPYYFPLTEIEMRPYIPNVSFGRDEPEKTGQFGDIVSDTRVLKALVLVATRALRDEEILLDYRLRDSEMQPAWYTQVDEEEDQQIWS